MSGTVVVDTTTNVVEIVLDPPSTVVVEGGAPPVIAVDNTDNTLVVEPEIQIVEVTDAPTPVIEINNDATNVIEIAAVGPQGPPGAGGAIGYYGTFFDTQDQPFLSVGTAQLVKINTLDGHNGMAIAPPGRMIIEHPGTYTLIFSVQLKNTANEAHYADIWLRYMGSDYPDSTTRFHIPARKNTNEPGYAVAVVNFVGTSINPNDYVELWWSANDTAVSIETIPAGTNPTTPLTPSVIATITQVASTIQGPQGPQGPQGNPGPNAIGGYPITVASATNGDVLSFNGSAWYNRLQETLADGGNF